MEKWRYILLDFAARLAPVRKGGADAIVVVTPGHLGDILHAVPMLRELRAAKPNDKIIWLAGPWSESLTHRYAHFCDEIHNIGPNSPNYVRGITKYRQNWLFQLIFSLKMRKMGVKTLIAAQNGFGRFLANAMRPELWIGVGDRRPPRVSSKIETVVQPYEKDRYEADSWMGLLKPLGIEETAQNLEYIVKNDEKAAATAFLTQNGIKPKKPLVLMAPGSGWSGKNWMPERFAAVSDWLKSSKNCQIAWIGGPDEENLFPITQKDDFNWISRTSLPILAGIMEKSTLFIGNDSGLLHFASALNLPTISLWGPTNPQKWGPKGSNHRKIRNYDQCHGCKYWDYRAKCLKDNLCMKAISVNDVINAIQTLDLFKND